MSDPKLLITANEARILTKTSESAINGLLAQIDSRIKEAASAGANEADIGSIHCDFRFSGETFTKPNTSPVASKVITQLRLHGYVADMTKIGEPRGVARGLGDKTGDPHGPQYQQWSIVVKW